MLRSCVLHHSQSVLPLKWEGSHSMWAASQRKLIYRSRWGLGLARGLQFAGPAVAPSSDWQLICCSGGGEGRRGKGPGVLRARKKSFLV